MRRLLAVVALATTTVVPLPLAASADPCPAARTCADFSLTDYRWSVAPGQRLVIPYYVNPINPWVPEDSVAPMAKAAAAVWERANPRVRFDFRGTTTAAPGVQDGLNVIGWGPPLLPQELAHAPTFLSPDNALVEADVVMNIASATTWDPCEQRDGSCSGRAEDIAPGTYTSEAQGILSHELGHWLSLDHPEDGTGSELTMHAVLETQTGKRYQTLGLGDTLGVRAAYPCGRCGGKPRIFSP